MAESQTHSVKPVAVVSSSRQPETLGAGGPLVSGLTPLKEARLIARSFNWRRGARFPTRTPVDQIKAQAHAENRGLSPVEQAVVTAAELLDGYAGDCEPVSYRDEMRNQTIRAIGVRLILEAEKLNQADDHIRAKLRVPSGVGLSSIVNVGVAVAQNEPAIGDLSPEERRSRLNAIAERIRLQRLERDRAEVASAVEPATSG